MIDYRFIDKCSVLVEAKVSKGWRKNCLAERCDGDERFDVDSNIR